MAEKNGNIVRILNDLLRHYYLLFPAEEVLEVFRDSGIMLNRETGFIKEYKPDIPDLFNYFFEKIFSVKGFSWIALVDNDLRKITTEHNIRYPDLYNSSIYKLQQKCGRLENEKNSLLDYLRKMETDYKNRSFKDPLGQVYKEDMFIENLSTDISAFRELGIEFGFFILEIDNLNSLNIKYGRETGDELLANAAYLLKNFKKTSKNYAHHLIFRMNGPRFTYYCTDITREEIIAIAEDVRTGFRESKFFITNITVSIGIAHSSEFSDFENDPADLSVNIIEVANSRLRLAKHRGTDSVCSESETAACFDREKYIMVIDPDIGTRYILETHLKGSGFNTASCAMGDEALEKIDINKPSAIISALKLPKMDGFSLRKKMLEDSALKSIPFILTSAVKDEKSVIRAQSLGIYHYLKKPYSIVELIGIVKKLSEDEV